MKYLISLLLMLIAVNVGAEDDTKYYTLAKNWAPYIVHDTEYKNGYRQDFITRWDYDDMDPTNNWERLYDAGVDLSANVYYAAIETESHYFLSYFIYHPRDWTLFKSNTDESTNPDIVEQDLSLIHEHDLEGLTICLRKPATSKEDFVFMYTEAHDDAYYFANNIAQIIDCNDQLVFTSTDHLDNNFGNRHLTTTESRQVYFINNHPVVFVEAGGHGVGQLRRALSETGDDVVIEGASYGFYGEDGITYIPSMSNQAGTPNDSAAIQTVEYKLLPFYYHIWMRRHSGDGLLNEFENITTNRGVIIADMGMEFHSEHDLFSPGPGGNPPWSWPELKNCGGCEEVCQLQVGRKGDYFLDPAEFSAAHLSGLPELTDWRYRTYISNVYLLGDNEIELNNLGSTVIGGFLDITWTYSESSTGTGLSDHARIILHHSEGDSLLGEVSASSGNWMWNPVAVPAAGPYYIEIRCDSEIGDWLQAIDIYGPLDVDSDCPSVHCEDVVPDEGGISTEFTFEVDYRDPNGNPPIVCDLIIDGIRYPMEAQGTVDWITGTTMKAFINGEDIGCGDYHEYYYQFSDGLCGQVIQCPESSVLQGPEVEGSSVRLSIVEPNGDDTVDITLVNPQFIIEWTASIEDTLQDALLHVTLYWDTDRNPDNGMNPIGECDGIASGDGHEYAGQCIWDMSGLSEGNYYIYGIANDDVCGTEEDDYSNGFVYLGDPYFCSDIWEEIPTPIYVAGAYSFDIAVDDLGAWHIVYSNNSTPNSVMYTKRTNQWPEGVMWTTPVEIAQCTDSVGDQISICIDGELIDVVYEKHLTIGECCSEIFHVRSTDDGVTWSDEHQITQDDGHWSRYPVIASSDGVLHVAWGTNYGDEGITAVCYGRSVNAGNSWTTTDMSDSSVGLRFPDNRPDIFALNGTVHIGWTDYTHEGTFYRRSMDSGESWGPRVELFDGGKNLEKASLLAHGDEVYVAWNNKSELTNYIAISGDGGNSFAAAIPISSDLQAIGPSLGIYNGKLYLFRNGNGDTLVYTASTDGGEHWCSDNIMVSALDGDYPIAFNGGNFAGVISVRNSENKRLYIHRSPSPDMTPIMLSSFELVMEPDGILCKWHTETDSSAEEFILIGKRGDLEWPVNAIEAQQNQYSALDNNALMKSGGSVTYCLYLRSGSSEKTLLAERTAYWAVPDKLSLNSVMPNPFNPSAIISYSLPMKCKARLSVYDLRGRVIAILADGWHDSGHHKVQWNGNGLHGRPVASGTYIVRLEANGGMESRKVLLAK